MLSRRAAMTIAAAVTAAAWAGRPCGADERGPARGVLYQQEFPGQDDLFPIPTTQVDARFLEPDEVELNSLIEQTGARDYATRQAATEKLKALGPESVPALWPWRDHDDPEVRARVQEVLAEREWMMRGALVVPGMVQRTIDTKKHPDGNAYLKEQKEKGWVVKSGDVIVKVDDQDVIDAHVPAIAEPETYHVLRDGRLIEMKMRGTRMTCSTVAWDVRKGGANHCRGVRDLRARQYPQALSRLRAAAAQGMDDPWSLGVTAVLAMHLEDRRTAIACYDRFMASRSPAGPSQYMIGQLLDEFFSDLWLDEAGLRTLWLVRRMEAARMDDNLRLAANAYFLDWGRNFDLARRCLVDRPYRPDDLAANRTAAFRQIVTLTWSGDLDKAMDYYRASIASDDAYAGWLEFACYVPLRLGLVEEPARRVGPWLDNRSSNVPEQIYENAARATAEALSAALSAGRFDVADDIWRRLDAARPAVHEQVMRYGRMCGLDQRPGAAWLIRGLDRYVQGHPTADQSARLLAQLYATAPTNERVDLEPVLAAFAEPDPLLASQCRLTLAIRQGRVDQASDLWAQWLTRELDERPGRLEQVRAELTALEKQNSRDYDLTSKLNAQVRELTSQLNQLRKMAEPDNPLAAALALLKASGNRPAAESALLAGTLAVYPGPDGGRFALKCDGGVVYVDREGKPHPTGGLDPDLLPFPARAPLPAPGDFIVTHPTGSLYVHRHHVYLFDREKRAWVSTGMPCERGLGVNAASTVRMLEHLVKHHPAPPGGRRIAWAVMPYRNERWKFYGFWGDVVIADNGTLNKVVDLSGEIARRLGREKPVRVFNMSYGQGVALWATEAGLWRMRMDGELSRFDLPIPSQDVTICVFKDPADEKQRLYGVAPQQGGQVFRYDRDADRFTLIPGAFTPYGPDDCTRHNGGLDKLGGYPGDDLPLLWSFAMVRAELGARRRAQPPADPNPSKEKP